MVTKAQQEQASPLSPVTLQTTPYQTSHPQVLAVVGLLFISTTIIIYKCNFTEAMESYQMIRNKTMRKSIYFIIICIHDKDN